MSDSRPVTAGHVPDVRVLAGESYFLQMYVSAQYGFAGLTDQRWRLFDCEGAVLPCSGRAESRHPLTGGNN
jgi:hypothetical protein